MTISTQSGHVHVTFTVVTSWFVAERAKAFAVLTLVGGLASPLFIPLSGWLLPQVGWRTTLLWYGVLHLVIAVPLHRWLVRRAPDHQHLENGTPSERAPEPSSTARQALVKARALADRLAISSTRHPCKSGSTSPRLNAVYWHGRVWPTPLLFSGIFGSQVQS